MFVSFIDFLRHGVLNKLFTHEWLIILIINKRLFVAAQTLYALLSPDDDNGVYFRVTKSSASLFILFQLFLVFCLFYCCLYYVLYVYFSVWSHSATIKKKKIDVITVRLPMLLWCVWRLRKMNPTLKRIYNSGLFICNKTSKDVWRIWHVEILPSNL